MHADPVSILKVFEHVVTLVLFGVSPGALLQQDRGGPLTPACREGEHFRSPQIK